MSFAAPLSAALDARRSVYAPGVRVYAMEPAGPTSRGFVPITIGTDTTGRIRKGFEPLSGWLEGEGTDSIPLAVKLVESRLLTRAILLRITGLALQKRRETVATIYEVKVVGIPVVGAKPVWRFTGTRTRMPYTPSVSGGGFPYTFPFALS